MLAHHPPAVKVGGRRLSVSSKPKATSAGQEPPVAQDASEADSEPPTDYPRPAPPGDRDECDEGERKKHGYGHPEKGDRKAPHEGRSRKPEETVPTKDGSAVRRAEGVRIDQPAGKGLGL